MFFAHTSRVLAWFLLVYAVASIGFGFAIASDWLGPRGAEVLARYWPNSTTGEMIDRGTVWLVVGAALGTLAEAAFALRLRSVAL